MWSNRGSRRAMASSPRWKTVCFSIIRACYPSTKRQRLAERAGLRTHQGTGHDHKEYTQSGHGRTTLIDFCPKRKLLLLACENRKVVEAISRCQRYTSLIARASIADQDANVKQLQKAGCDSRFCAGARRRQGFGVLLPGRSMSEPFRSQDRPATCYLSIRCTAGPS